MGKIQQFKNKPTPNSFGQYYYDNDDMNNFQPLEESDSVVKPIDKFSDKTLHSLVVSDSTRDYIVNNKLRNVGVSGIKINKLEVKENSTTGTHIDCNYRGFICDRNTFDCFDDNGNLKGYGTIESFFRTNSENGDDKETCQFFRLEPGNIGDNGAPDFSFLTDKYIVKNLSPDLTNGLQIESGDYLEDSSKDIVVGLENLRNAGESIWNNSIEDNTEINPNYIPFKPYDNTTDTDNRLTSIFSENGDDNYIQIVIYLKSNKDRGGGSGKSRRRRYYVLKISPSDVLDLSTLPPTPGEFHDIPIVVSHNDGIEVREGHESKQNDECDKPAWTLSNLSVTIKVGGGVSADDFSGVSQNILNQVEPRNPINESNLDLDFTTINLFQEPFTSAISDSNLWIQNFTPFSQITINNRLDKNLQGFKTNDLDRQICSSPTSVSLRVDISQYSNVNDYFIERAFAETIPPHYKVCVVHWDDVDDEFTTVQDVFDKKPTDFEEIITAQDNNTFILKDYSETFNHNYTTPGIKKIKILVFNYVEYRNDGWDNTYSNSQLPPFEKIEPIRYKLLTSRIFLDIPISEFEDFGELGGTEYRTIPWPYTTPVIGGVSEDSKYKKSINDILGGGKIGNADIIDERFLIQSRDNNEIGKNIEQMDLEQCRYFDTPYDMNTLLLIPTSGVTGWDDYELAKKTDLFVTNQIEGTAEDAPTQYYGINSYNLENTKGLWTEADYQLIFDGINEYTMYMKDTKLGDRALSDSNTFMNRLLKNEVIFDGNFATPHILPYKTYGPSLDMESYISEEMVLEFFKNENFTPTLDELEIEGNQNPLFIKSRTNGTSTYYQGYGYFGSVDEVMMSTFQSGPEVYEEAAPRINLNPDGTPSSIEWLQILNKSNQDTQFSHPDFPVLFYYYQDMELYNQNGEMRLTELKMGESVPLPVGMFTTIVIPDKLYTSDLINEIQFLNESISVQDFFQLPLPLEITIPHPYTERDFWVANPEFPGTFFPEESSVGQIFITENQDLELKQSCKLELNTGELTGKSIYDSSGNSNKGLLIGDYKLKKNAKGQTMRRDSFIKVPKKANNSDGAL